MTTDADAILQAAAAAAVSARVFLAGRGAVLHRRGGRCARENRPCPSSERSFNQTVLYGKDVDVHGHSGPGQAVSDDGRTSVVIVKEAQAVADLEQERSWPFLEAYLKNPLASTVLVLCYKHKTLDSAQEAGQAAGRQRRRRRGADDQQKLYDNQVPQWLTANVRSPRPADYRAGHGPAGRVHRRRPEPAGQRSRQAGAQPASPASPLTRTWCSGWWASARTTTFSSCKRRWCSATCSRPTAFWATSPPTPRPTRSFPT
ncbi:MAG: hypothetical protein WKG07_11905 [Hymenobacter sp.]